MSYATKEQQAEYARGHYLLNKQVYQDRAKAGRDRAKTFVQILKSQPCVDCGGSFHYSAMDFDHTDGKTINLSRAVGRKWSNERILIEIAKCDLVCSNCHRVRTYKRLVALET